jgi:hypothetical protein
LAQNRGAEAFHVEIANGYTAFEADSADSGGDACKAGLLTELTGRSAGTCGIHPSLAGQAVLALAVEESVEK